MKAGDPIICNIDFQPNLTKGKQLIEEEEINAWDFSLSIMDRLKILGLDLSRGFKKKQIDKGIKMCLSSYKILHR